MDTAGYNVRKAAQVAAYFALRQGGRINVLKLAKLLYLADREHMASYDMPILFDRFVSMQHGPVTSITLDHVNGMSARLKDWDAFVAVRSGYDVPVAAKDLSTDDLDELSDAEVDTLDAVWERFGQMSGYEVRDWTHANCPEWEDPENSSFPIPYERVLKSLGKEQANEIARHIEEIGGIATAAR